MSCVLWGEVFESGSHHGGEGFFHPVDCVLSDTGQLAKCCCSPDNRLLSGKDRRAPSASSSLALRSGTIAAAMSVELRAVFMCVPSMERDLEVYVPWAPLPETDAGGTPIALSALE